MFSLFRTSSKEEKNNAEFDEVPRTPVAKALSSSIERLSSSGAAGSSNQRKRSQSPAGCPSSDEDFSDEK